jgi:hypothetical protein
MCLGRVLWFPSPSLEMRLRITVSPAPKGTHTPSKMLVRRRSDMRPGFLVVLTSMLEYIPQFPLTSQPLRCLSTLP